MYRLLYNIGMLTVIWSNEFDAWLEGLRDRAGVARILTRIRRAEQGNLGDTSYIGEGIHEMRIFTGPGYRIYYVREGQTIIVLLWGGDKDSQQRDIERANRLAHDWRERHGS